MMLVSIITVCLNSERTIKETLESVAKQRYKNIEHIIVDGGSTDNTLNIIHEYSGVVTRVISEKDEGIYDAMNKGIRISNGDIIYFLNSDDVLYDSKVISDVVKEFKCDHAIGILYGNVIYRYGTSCELRRFGHISANNILYENLCHQAVFAKRTVFDRVGVFDTSYQIVADYDWLLRALLSGVNIRYIDRIIAYFNAMGAHAMDRELSARERYSVKMKYKSARAYKIGEIGYRILRKIRKAVFKYDARGPVKKLIAMVAYPPGYTGIAQYSCLLFKSLSCQLKAVHLLCNKRVNCQGVEDERVHKIFLRSRMLPISIARVINFVERELVGLVHFQDHFKYPLLTLMLTILFRKTGIKVIYTCHDVLPHNAKWYHPYILKKLYNNVNGLIVHSESNKRAIIGMGVNPGKIKVIPHGLFGYFYQIGDICKDDAREMLGIDSKKKVLLFFGSIVKRKGAERILEEMPKILAACDDVVLVMAGHNGYPKGYLERLIKKLGLEEYVKFFGERVPDEDVGLFFSAADAVILPYLECSTSGVIKVAFAFGVPVISTRVGELEELVTKNNAGELIDFPLTKGDISKITKVLREPTLYYSEESLKRFKTEYSWDNIAEKTKELYVKVYYDVSENNK